jgi:N-carbamoylputrescine amidase
MGNNVTICAIQGGPCTRDISKNIDQHLLYLKNAVEQYHPKIVCFSEYTVIPAFCSSQSPENFKFSQSINGAIANAFSDAAKKYGIYLCVNLFEDCGNGIYYNTSPLFGPNGDMIFGRMSDGSVLQRYQKVHIPSSMDEDGTLRANEKTYFHPGKGPAVFDTEYGKIGILICWDKRFTELWKIYGLLGAHIVLNPMATWGGWRGSTYADEMRIMAMYNQYYVVGVGKSGTETVFDEKTLTGGSIIAGPDGSILAHSHPEPGKAIAVEIDIELVQRTRILTPIYRDRRPELYNPITS